MDLNFRKYIYALLLLLATAATSCVKEPGSGEGERGALRFNLLDDPMTRLAYDGVHTSFENGESLGCVIAVVKDDGYEFGSVTEWKYNDGRLTLVTEGDRYVKKCEDDGKAGYIQFHDQTREYAFFFYYPYVSSSLPNAGTWTSYTMSVATDFRSGMQVLEGSDHLRGTYKDDMERINLGEFYDVSLTFRKLTATVEIHSDNDASYEISNLYINAITGTEGVKTAMDYNLATGDFVAHTPYDGLIYPVQMEEEHGGNIHDHGGLRMLFVPQTIRSWRLHATITEGTESYDYSVPLEDKLNVLEAGKQYIFHITKAENGQILIQNWDDDVSDQLFGEEIPVPTGLTMYSPDRPGNATDQLSYVEVKNGERICIYGTGFFHNGVNMIHHIEVGETRVTNFTTSELDSNGYRTISFTLPEAARSGIVNLVLASGVRVSPGRVVTVVPEVTGLSKDVFNIKKNENSSDLRLTVYGNDLDLVSSITFGGGSSTNVTYNPENGNLEMNIPIYARTGELILNLKNGTSHNSGRSITINSSSDHAYVAEVRGRYIAGETITISGSRLGEVKHLWLTGATGSYEFNSFTVSQDQTRITFTFPEQARDGTLEVYLKQQNNDKFKIYETSYETVKPSYLEVLHDNATGYLTVVGFDLDVVKTVVLNGNAITGWSYDPKTGYITFASDAETSGKVTLTTKNGYPIEVPYSYTPAVPVVSQIQSPSGNIDGIANYVYAKAGEVITMIGEGLNLVSYMKVSDRDVAVTRADDGKSLTFVFPEITHDGIFSMVLTNNLTETAGGYRVVGDEKEPISLWQGTSAATLELGKDNDIWETHSVKVGDILRIYIKDVNSGYSNITVYGGHWGTPWLNLTNPAAGYVEIIVDATIHSTMMTKLGWGSALIVQSNGLTVTQIVLVQR